MGKRRLFYRILCVVCGCLGAGIYVEALRLGGWFVWVGVTSLLMGLVTASMVVRRW